MGQFKMPPQIFRLVLLTIGIVTSYLIARQLLTPPSFKDYGFSRGDALEEMASKKPVFAGRKACDECHSEITIKLAKGDHKKLSCEGCHGVSLEHVGNPDITPVKLTGSHCIRCHESNPSRPSWFRQITVKNHYSEQKCTECHVPHQPNEVP